MSVSWINDRKANAYPYGSHFATSSEQPELTMADIFGESEFLANAVKLYYWIVTRWFTLCHFILEWFVPPASRTVLFLGELLCTNPLLFVLLCFLVWFYWGFISKSKPYVLSRGVIVVFFSVCRRICTVITSCVYCMTPFRRASAFGVRKFGNHMVGKAFGDKEWHYLVVDRMLHDHSPVYRFAMQVKDGIEVRIPCPGCNESILAASIVDAYQHSIVRPEYIGHIAFCDPSTKLNVGCGTFWNFHGFLVTARHTFYQKGPDPCILAVHPQHAIIYKNFEAGNNRRAIDFSKLQHFVLKECGSSQQTWNNTGQDLIAFKMPPGVLSSLGIKEAKLSDLCWQAEGIVSVYGNPNMTTDKSTAAMCVDEKLMIKRGLVSHQCSTVSGFSGSPICLFEKGKFKIVGMHTIGDFMSDGRNHGSSVANIFALASVLGIVGKSIPPRLNESRYERKRQAMPEYYDEEEEWLRKHAQELADQAIQDDLYDHADDEEKRERVVAEADLIYDRIHGGDVEWNPEDVDAGPSLWGGMISNQRGAWGDSFSLSAFLAFIERFSSVSDDKIAAFAESQVDGVVSALSFDKARTVPVTPDAPVVKSVPEPEVDSTSVPVVEPLSLPESVVVHSDPTLAFTAALAAFNEQAAAGRDQMDRLERMVAFVDNMSDCSESEAEELVPAPTVVSEVDAVLLSLPAILAAVTQQGLDSAARLERLEAQLAAKFEAKEKNISESVKAKEIPGYCSDDDPLCTDSNDTAQVDVPTSLPGGFEPLKAVRKRPRRSNRAGLPKIPESPLVPREVAIEGIRRGAIGEELMKLLRHNGPTVPGPIHNFTDKGPLSSKDPPRFPGGSHAASVGTKDPAWKTRVGPLSSKKVPSRKEADYLVAMLEKTAVKRRELEKLVEPTLSESKGFEPLNTSSASLFGSGMCHNESVTISNVQISSSSSKIERSDDTRSPSSPPKPEISQADSVRPVYRPHVYLLEDLDWILGRYDSAGMCAPLLMVELRNRAEDNGLFTAADPRTPGELDVLFSEEIRVAAETTAAEQRDQIRALAPRRMRVFHLWNEYCIQEIARDREFPSARSDWLNYGEWFEPGVPMVASPVHYNYVTFDRNPFAHNQSVTLTSLQLPTGDLSDSFCNGAPFMSRFADPQGLVSSGGKPKSYVDHFMSDDVEIRVPRNFKALGGVGTAPPKGAEALFRSCFDDPLNMLQFVGMDPDLLLDEVFHELKEYKDAGQIKLQAERIVISDSHGNPMFVRIATCGAPSVPGTSEPTKMSQEALDVLSELGMDFKDAVHGSKFVLPPSAVSGCEESIRAQALDMDVLSNMDDVVTPEQMEILAACYAEYPPTSARFVVPPREGASHYDKLENFFTEIYNSFDGLKSSGWSALYKKGPKRSYLGDEASRGFLSKVIMQTWILRLVYGAFIGCMTPIEMVLAGLKDPSILFSKKEAHSSKKASLKSWRQIWCCSLRDSVCTLLVHYMQNKADITAYALGGFHCQAIGLGHHDLGIERFGQTLDYLVSKSPDGRLYDRDATGWDLSVCRDAIVLDAERRSFCARESVRKPCRLVLLFRLLMLHAMISSAHVACIGKWLWECLKAGITDSGGPSTSAQNSPIRQIQAMLAGAFAACSLGDDLITAGDVIEALLRRWGVKTKVLANGAGSNPANGPHDYTSHRWRRTKEGVWTAEFLNLEKLIAHADLRTVPTADGVRLLADDARSGMLFCLRHSPDQALLFERFCRGMGWWKEGSVPLDVGFFFE